MSLSSMCPAVSLTHTIVLLGWNKIFSAICYSLHDPRSTKSQVHLLIQLRIPKVIEHLLCAQQITIVLFRLARVVEIQIREIMLGSQPIMDNLACITAKGHSFIHSFTQKTVIDSLPCAGLQVVNKDRLHFYPCLQSRWKDRSQ